MGEDQPSLNTRTQELKDGLAAEICRAFLNVDRLCGVSWSETAVLDGYGSVEERLTAKALDTDANWEQVETNPEWNPDSGWGGWAFLDPIGFRYYLPAAMMRCLRSGHDEGIASHLTLPESWSFPTFNSDLSREAFYQNQSRDHTLEQWSALDKNQRSCVKKFLLYMLEIDKPDPEWGKPSVWDGALMSYWLDID